MSDIGDEAARYFDGRYTGKLPAIAGSTITKQEAIVAYEVGGCSRDTMSRHIVR
jgi:hypothetical protein